MHRDDEDDDDDDDDNDDDEEEKDEDDDDTSWTLSAAIPLQAHSQNWLSHHPVARSFNL